jgi:hypothetical protein
VQIDLLSDANNQDEHSEEVIDTPCLKDEVATVESEEDGGSAEEEGNV